MELTLFLASSAILLLVLLRKSRPKAFSLPPGPRPIPILGNALDFTIRELWMTTHKWAAQYGDVCHLHVLGWDIIFLNSAEAADELLERRGAIYSDRPILQMSGELCGVERLLPLSKYDATFKRQRRYIQQTLGPRSIPAYHSTLRNETQLFLQAIVNNPPDYLSHIRKYAGGLTLSVVYGYQVTSSDDKFLAIAEECLLILANEIAAGSGIWAVDIFPQLKYVPSWFPGGGFKSKAARWKLKMTAFVNEPFTHAKSATRDGTILPSFLGNILCDGDLDETLENDIKYSANSMYAASADTTVTSISHFILAMAMHPKVLKRAQEEIDHVVGGGRLPDFHDRESLPYVDAVMSEVWRWGVPIPLNLPHCSTQDDVYRGMHIPKGSIVIGNIWTILRDGDLFPNPDEFNPEHFAPDVDADLKLRREPRNYIFGFGRRRCPGADLVESSIWLLIVSMIATMDIKKAVDDKDNIIEPIINFSNSVFRVPDKFQFSLTPRSPSALALFSGGLP